MERSNERTRLLKELKSLGDEVRRVLLADWDPIGVGRECPDEYDSYIPQICRMIVGGAPVAELARHLGDVAKTEMVLSCALTRDRMAAETLLALLTKEPDARD